MNRTAVFALAVIFVISGAADAQQIPDGEPPSQDGPPALDDSFPAKTLAAACAPAAGLDQNAKAVADQMCDSYLRGLTEGMYVTGLITGGRGLCLPRTDPIKIDEAKREFQDYLAANPDVADHSAGLATMIGIIRAHPCD